MTMFLRELEQEQEEPVYADTNALKQIASQFQQLEPEERFDIQGASPSRGKPIPHIRVFGVSPQEVKALINKVGGVEKTPDMTQQRVSGKFPVVSFEKDKQLFSVAISMTGLDKGATRGIARKELSPTGLGLGGGFYSKNDLVTKTQAAVEKIYRKKDPALADALINLLKNALAGGNETLPQEQMTHITPYLGTLAQDFGEILAPILMMDNNDIAELPSGNEALVDVKIPGRGNISVKALTGSGTSFRAIAKYMDAYEEAIENDNDQEKKKRFAILKQFNPVTGGKNVDKIIRAVAQANTAEYQALTNLLGSAPQSYEELADLIQKYFQNVVKINGTYATYTEFLRRFYPVMTAGPWGKPVGLPADGKYYMNPEGDAPKAKAAGKTSYDGNPTKGGADIITYALGVGLLNYIKLGDDSDHYRDMMTDIVKQADAVLGHITIAQDGRLSLTTKPFSDLQFNFQYHAPSHIPGNNLPGFMAIL